MPRGLTMGNRVAKVTVRFLNASIISVIAMRQTERLDSAWARGGFIFVCPRPRRPPKKINPIQSSLIVATGDVFIPEPARTPKLTGETQIHEPNNQKCDASGRGRYSTSCSCR